MIMVLHRLFTTVTDEYLCFVHLSVFSIVCTWHTHTHAHTYYSSSLTSWNDLTHAVELNSKVVEFVFCLDSGPNRWIDIYHLTYRHIYILNQSIFLDCLSQIPWIPWCISSFEAREKDLHRLHPLEFPLLIWEECCYDCILARESHHWHFQNHTMHSPVDLTRCSISPYNCSGFHLFTLMLSAFHIPDIFVGLFSLLFL